MSNMHYNIEVGNDEVKLVFWAGHLDDAFALGQLQAGLKATGITHSFVASPSVQLRVYLKENKKDND